MKNFVKDAKSYSQRNRDGYAKVIVVLVWLLIAISVGFFLMLVPEAECQTFKINRSDAFNSTVIQMGYRMHDKALHSTRGFLNNELGRLLLPESLKQYSELFAVAFSIGWEIKDGFDWRNTWGAEPKDIIAETAGVLVDWGFRKLPRKTRLFIMPGVVFVAYHLIKVK